MSPTDHSYLRESIENMNWDENPELLEDDIEDDDFDDEIEDESDFWKKPSHHTRNIRNSKHQRVDGVLTMLKWAERQFVKH